MEFWDLCRKKKRNGIPETDIEFWERMVILTEDNPGRKTIEHITISLNLLNHKDRIINNNTNNWKTIEEVLYGSS
jgi:hypothetical protein